VLREPIDGNVRDAVDSSRSSLDPTALRKSGQNGVSESRIPGLLRGEQSIVFLGKGDQFVKTTERHTSRLSGCAWVVDLVPLWNDSDAELGTPNRRPWRKATQSRANPIQ
jgi:hypothetical protein